MSRLPAIERSDEPDEDGKAKYLGPPGRTNIFYVPVGVKLEWLTDKTIPVVFVEGEKKCLALWRIARDNSADGVPLFIPIGLRGCYGWKGKIGNRELPNPGHEQEKGPINDFDFFEWEGRIVTLFPDSNYETNPKVKAAWNGLRDHTYYLLKARLFFAFMPQFTDFNGCDDLAGEQGPDAVLELLDNAIPAIKPPIKPETKEERLRKKEAWRQMVQEQSTKEDEYTQTRRRATSADFAALSVTCAELGFSDKSRVGLQALIALSEGRRSIIWKYEHLYGFHIFRHSAGTIIHRLTKDGFQSKEMLGHSDIKTTETYVHRDDKLLRETAELSQASWRTVALAGATVH